MITNIKPMGVVKIVAVLLALMLIPKPAHAQEPWPPFRLGVDSVYENGRITYNLRFSRRVNWPMADVVFKIPLPEGTRFIESGAPATTVSSFDGAEITFSTPVLHRSLKDIYFVVEITDPTRTEFITHAWISWKGERPGDYLTGDISIDITRTPLIWQKPRPRLRLEAGATVNGDIVTYNFYPVNVGGRRMWDLTILVPIPPGATFISADAPSPFTAGFTGQEAVFTILEMPRRDKVAPLQVTVSTKGITAPFITTQAQASWTNVGRNAPTYEHTTSGIIIVQPHTSQQVAADTTGDAPFDNYDLTGVSFQEDDDALKTTLFTAGPMGAVGEPVEYFLYIDSDCNAETGKPRGNRGAEYWVRYRQQSGKAYFYTWDAETAQWTNRRTIGAYASEINLATVWIPYNYISNPNQFCWLGLAWNRTEEYHPSPPIDWLGVDPRLTEYTALTGPAAE